MARKRFVLDTNVLLHDSQSITSFQEHEVVIPLVVIEEMDQFKKDGGETGRNARQVARLLDALRLKGVLTNGGLPLSNGGLLRVVVSGTADFNALPPELRAPTVYNQILALALHESRRGTEPVVVVTKDINLRIKAHAVGLSTEDYETDKVAFDHLYSGSREIDVTGEVIDRFYREKKIQPPVEVFPHQCLTMRNVGSEQHSAIGRFDPESGSLVPDRHPSRSEMRDPRQA